METRKFGKLEKFNMECISVHHISELLQFHRFRILHKYNKKCINGDFFVQYLCEFHKRNEYVTEK